MPFQKGRAKTGGRVKGGNQVTREVMALLDAMGHNPIENLIKLAQNKKNRPDLRARCEMFLADKYLPSLKAITVSGPAGGPIEHNVTSARERLEAGISRIAERNRTEGST